MPYYYYLVLDLVVVAALFVLSFVVILRDRRAELNLMLALFSISISVWILANYISNDLSLRLRTATIANYFVFCFSYLATIALLRFAIILANDVKAKHIFNIFYPALLLVGFSAATPLVVSGVALQGDVYAVDFGPGIILYGICLLTILSATFMVLHKNWKRSTGNQKARLKVLYQTLSLAVPVTILAQFILPAATGWFGLTNIGILPMLLLVFGLYYGVVKHKMFDLRFFVLRGGAYLVSTVVLGVLYVAPIVFFMSIVVLGFPFVWYKFLLAVFVGTVASLNYARLRRWFDKNTAKIFFRDNYDSAALLGELNRVLVSTTDLSVMLRRSAELISMNLKSEFCSFALNATTNTPERIIGTANRRFTESNFKKLRGVSHINSGVVIADYVEEDQHELKTSMVRNNIAVLVYLSSNNAEAVNVDLGYIMLGYKKSGYAYNNQDTQTLDSIADVLVIAIQNALHFEEIQNFNITLQQRVDTATSQLRRTNAKLEALDETKDDFISMASHQLRTPLTAVKGYLSMVLEGDAGSVTPLQKKMLNQAFLSSQRMVFLIADLLNVSRLKTGKFIIERGPINLANLIQEEIGQLRETAKSQSLELTYDKPKDFPLLMLDETKTRQVVMNFIDNAIHYTPAGGHIHVELADKPQTVELRVRDDGIGVPSSEQHHLFTKFYRAVNARRERPDGTGLGLFMAKKVVVAQGGAVLFDSRENHGSTFGFTMPKRKLLVPIIDKTSA